MFSCGHLLKCEITNEEIRATIPKYVDVVTKLVSQRQERCGTVVKLRGKERVARFFVLSEVCVQLAGAVIQLNRQVI